MSAFHLVGFALLIGVNICKSEHHAIDLLCDGAGSMTRRCLMLSPLPSPPLLTVRRCWYSTSPPLLALCQWLWFVLQWASRSPTCRGRQCTNGRPALRLGEDRCTGPSRSPRPPELCRLGCARSGELAVLVGFGDDLLGQTSVVRNPLRGLHLKPCQNTYFKSIGTGVLINGPACFQP